MPAILAISPRTDSRTAGLGPIRRVQAVDTQDHATSRQDEPMRHGGVVHSFRAHAGMHADRDNTTDAVLVDERRARPPLNGWGPAGQGAVLTELPDVLPDRLSDFRVGSALEAQLVTPNLDQLHAAVMARRAG